MARDVSDATPISGRDELIEWIAAGAKPRGEWRLGTEHEKIPFYVKDESPVPYEGGIRALLEGLADGSGWQAIM
jgi:glutamate--cysteine ligase